MIRPSSLRPIASMATRRAAFAGTTAPRHFFHSTPRALIKPGDPLPDTDALMENTPGQRVNLADEAQKVNNMLLIGVPAAFSPACSATHIPGYAGHPGTKNFDTVGVVSVNDVFVCVSPPTFLFPRRVEGCEGDRVPDGFVCAA